MGIAYCSYCEKGMHYTDVCLGGKNGKPKLTSRQYQIKTTKVWLFAIIYILTILFGMLFIITNQFRNWN